VRRNRTIAVTALVVVLALSIGITVAVRGAAMSPQPPAPATGVDEPDSASTENAGFDRSALSLDDPASLWVVVNKVRPLSPADFAAADLVDVPVAYVHQPRLRAEAADATVAMFDAFAQQTGLAMQSQSAYRSYGSQQSVYAGWVESLGVAAADLTSARAGYSEHQTGLAIDIAALPAECSLDQCFATTPQGQWAQQHAWEFGFIVRYPADKTAITGYEYEPWHLRYVGTVLAAEMHDTGVTTLEEFFGLAAAPTYLG
jgi:zinc D-Ala-D-Ala carboxypeptidase